MEHERREGEKQTATHGIGDGARETGKLKVVLFEEGDWLGRENT